MDQTFATESRYRWSSNSQNQQEIGIIDDSKAFYDDFYRFLSDSGVDYVKVDNQGSFQELSSTDCQENFVLWNKFRRAMVDSGDTFLSGRVLHCMALTPHVLFDPVLSSMQKPIFRQVVPLKRASLVLTANHAIL